MPSPREKSTLGVVVSAFPATGKSYVAGRDHRFADSDSSRFSWESPGVRHPNWPSNYVEHIQATRADGTTVLVSAHQEVRDALVEAGIPFALVYPSEDQRDGYVERMYRRGSPDGLVGFVQGNWHDLLASCRAQQDCNHAVLKPGQYLSDVLEPWTEGVR